MWTYHLKPSVSSEHTKMAAHCPLIIFLCFASALLTAGAMAESEQGCPQGWTLFGSHCYKFFGTTMTWIEAEKSCHSHGANLPSIHSDEENAFIVDLIHGATGAQTHTWLGAYDAVQETTWLWSDGTPWDYTHWPPSNGQPDNAGGIENCLMINWDATYWNDAPVSWSLAYICAKELSPQTSVEPKPEPESGSKIVSLTLEGFVCKCTPQLK